MILIFNIQKEQHRANERMRLCTNLLNCEVASIMPRTPIVEKYKWKEAAMLNKNSTIYTRILNESPGSS